MSRSFVKYWLVLTIFKSSGSQTSINNIISFTHHFIDSNRDILEDFLKRIKLVQERLDNNFIFN